MFWSLPEPYASVRAPQRRSAAAERFGVPVAKLSQIALEEEVQDGPYHRDSAELPDLLPVWRNRRLDDVGCELESEASDEPASVAQPNLAQPAVCRWRRKCYPQSGEKCLGGSDGDDDQRHRIDDDDGVFRDEMQPFLHRPLL